MVQAPVQSRSLHREVAQVKSAPPTFGQVVLERLHLIGIEDAEHNTTRFVVLSASPEKVRAVDGPVITSFVFRVRNVPAALYKALGGFATNGVNMTKLESYQLEGSFNATMFYADIEGHPDERPVKLAMEELHFFSSEVTVLGTYPASPFRAELKASQD